MKPGFGQDQPLEIRLGQSTLRALSPAPCFPMKAPNDTARPEEPIQVMT